MNENICGYGEDIFSSYLNKYGISCNTFVSNSSSFVKFIILL